jgi:hypothetical protein
LGRELAGQLFFRGSRQQKPSYVDGNSAPALCDPRDPLSTATICF